MKRRFVTLDVFTDRRYAGNPLAVVLEADGLDAPAMQAIAREFNLSETLFVLPAEQPGHRARVRIFTPKRELDFAGHPIVGTAVLLGALDGGSQERAIVLEANIGPVPCRLTPQADGGEASFELPSLPVEVGAPPPHEALAAALGLAVTDIGFGSYVPSCWSAGVDYTFVPTKSRDAVRCIKPDLARFESVLTAPAHGAVYVFSAETVEPGRDFHARMFAPVLGVLEDPATGSAAAAFAGVLARFGGLADGDHGFVIEQGYEMGRPSVIRLDLTLADHRLTAARIAGGAVPVAEGTIEA